jgi:hypothetical protein
MPSGRQGEVSQVGPQEDFGLLEGKPGGLLLHGSRRVLFGVHLKDTECQGQRCGAGKQGSGFSKRLQRQSLSVIANLARNMLAVALNGK